MTKMIWAASITALLAVGQLAAQKPEAAETLLQTAIKKEVVDGNLAGAIEGYKKALAAAKGNRVIAAQALLRMAEAYQKLGDAQAKGVYERLVRDYPDQMAAVAVARARLGSPQQGDGPAKLTTQRVLDRGEPHDRISPDGRYLARVDSTGNLTLRELATGKVRALTSDANPTDPDHRYAYVSAFSHDGKQIAYQWYFEKDLRSVLRVVPTAEQAAGKPQTIYDNPDVDFFPTDWSPDGRWIAGVVRRKDHTAQIGLISVADRSLRVLKTIDWSRAGGVRFSPDSSLLAYHRPEKEGGFERDVFVIAVDGSRETVAAASPGDDIVLEWMADGQRLLIASDRGGSMSAWTVPARGQSPAASFELVKSDIGIISSLGPTRAGTLYYNLQPGGSRIYVADFDPTSGQLSSTPVQPVQQFKGLVSSPRWSNDGKYLAYASRRDVPAPINVTRPVVTILSMETGKVVRELHPAISYGGIGQWSPDGRQFIVRGSDLKGRDGIVRVDAMTGEAALVAPNEICSGIPYWAPDSKSVFCYRSTDQVQEIVQVDVVSGSVLRTFSAEGQGRGVSPDGRYIVFSTTRAVRLLALPTGETRELLRLSSPESQIRFTSMAWTPDSRSVVMYGRLRGDEGMWLVPIDGGPARKINVGFKPIDAWQFNPKTGQVAFSVGQGGPQLEVWKMEHFVPASTTPGAR